MEQHRFEAGPKPEEQLVNQSDEGLDDQSFFDDYEEEDGDGDWYIDEEEVEEELSLMDRCRMQNGFYVKPVSETTQEERRFKLAYGVWPYNLPEGWLNFLKDPDEDPGAWDLPDSYFE